jgi:microcystin-dependent protein
MKLLFTLLFIAWTSLWLQLSLYAQQQIQGIVSNKEGEALVGATLVIKGTNTFTVADLEGRFSLPVKVSLPFVLNVSSVGYTPQDLTFAELPQDSLRLTLADDNELTAGRKLPSRCPFPYR